MDRVLLENQKNNLNFSLYNLKRRELQEVLSELNVLIGFGIAGSGFGPILAVVGRSASPEKSSLALERSDLKILRKKRAK